MPPASARHPDRLCPPAILLRRCVSLALLDAILSPDWESRYYSFDAKWAGDECMASMRNGSGDDLFIVFAKAGTFLKGFNHEAEMAPARRDGALWPGMYTGIPPALHALRDEPAFSPEHVTFCLWWPATAKRWHVGVKRFPTGKDPDGSSEMLAIYDGNPETYAAFALNYFEIAAPVDAVAAVYRHEALTTELIAALNPDADFDAVVAESADWPYGE